MSAKILLLDIETSYVTAGVWGLWNQDISQPQLFTDRYILCWAAKWLNDDYTYHAALPDYPKLYRTDPSNDKELVRDLLKMIDTADIVVAHNGARFDLPIINARALVHGFKPPQPYRMVDTLTMAKRNFGFLSNRLDDLAKRLKVGQKVKHDGFQLWVDVIQNKDPRAWAVMSEYNIKDVEILEQVYLKMRGWDKTHPSVAVFGDMGRPSCTVCGSRKVYRKGTYKTNTASYQKWTCGDCGKCMRSGTAEKQDKTNLLRGA